MFGSMGLVRDRRDMLRQWHHKKEEHRYQEKAGVTKPEEERPHQESVNAKQQAPSLLKSLHLPERPTVVAVSKE
eukprot:CAMPEP_0194048666 /NCGR_PEP_ID=MMETSP0009_2-20130614/28066_1 /TAXON_ID=210454 /ORGANISM="Grammatophora oceanica, Strain CCMP 410" /LENGTH=73 /DNA_ID=CAMNT_0038694597 /DNA_START=162 /DNA_END=383 /DNA_ORIENTATION=+